VNDAGGDHGHDSYDAERKPPPTVADSTVADGEKLLARLQASQQARDSTSPAPLLRKVYPGQEFIPGGMRLVATANPEIVPGGGGIEFRPGKEFVPEVHGGVDD
jgi:hypothetical protein